METLVLAPDYAPLFTDEERAIAARRLDDVRAVQMVMSPVAPA
jgi:hypothetical protein